MYNSNIQTPYLKHPKVPKVEEKKIKSPWLSMGKKGG